MQFFIQNKLKLSPLMLKGNKAMYNGHQVPQVSMNYGKVKQQQQQMSKCQKQLTRMLIQVYLTNFLFESLSKVQQYYKQPLKGTSLKLLVYKRYRALFALLLMPYLKYDYKVIRVNRFTRYH